MLNNSLTVSYTHWATIMLHLYPQKFSPLIPLFLPSIKNTMNHKFVERISAELDEIRAAGLYKSERVITSAQGAEIEVNG